MSRLESVLASVQNKFKYYDITVDAKYKTGPAYYRNKISKAQPDSTYITFILQRH